jgi:hypothetical protein
MDPPVLMEPTGAETSSANGKAKRSIGLAGITTQLLLGMSNLEVIFWCFALLHGVILLNVHPHSESGISPFEALFKKKSQPVFPKHFWIYDVQSRPQAHKKTP